MDNFPAFLSSTTVLLLASLFFLLFIFQSKRTTNSKMGKQSPRPPGPKPWPLVGSLPELVRIKPEPAFRWILRYMEEKNIHIACFRLGNVHVIPVTCPRVAREFLKEQDAVFASRPINMATEYASRGFLTVAVTPFSEQWKRMKKILASEILSCARMSWLLDKRTSEADNLVRYIYNQCKSSAINNQEFASVVNLRLAIRQYSGNVIRNMVFSKRYFGEGREDGGPTAAEEEHVEAFFTMLDLAFVFRIPDYIPFLRWFDLDGHEKMMKEAIRIINKHHDPIIDERIEKWRSGNKKEPEDLLDVAISLEDDGGKPLLTTEEIKAVPQELIIAAMDNPSNAIEWAMAEMITNPEILEKAVEEIDGVVGKERLVQESDLQQLNYVKACAREAFRLHPTAAFNVPHESLFDTTVAGYFIPKGSHVLLSRRGLGRNPNVWDDPLKFKPERHLNDGKPVDLVEHELRFITFSTGRRGCMGVALGIAMTFMLLARLVQAFTWSVPPGEPGIDLSESTRDLFLGKPLHAYAKPRLPMHVYPTK